MATMFSIERMAECQKMDPPVWLSKDGRETLVRDLRHGHLENILVFIDKKMKTAEETLLELAHSYYEDAIEIEEVRAVFALWSLWVPIINAEIARRKTS